MINKNIFIKNKIIKLLIAKPISILYISFINIKNFLYDKKILSCKSFNKKILCVGNLCLGGSGKTPHVEYLIKLFLKNKIKVSILSRGYKRKSNGFLIANKKSNVKDIGDEPLQYFKKFGKNITIAVDSNRINGINNLIKINNPDIIILDDGFQDRKIKSNYNIILTEYNNLFYKDKIIPIGNLRDNPKRSKKANIILVTKCPKNININNINDIKKNIEKNSKQEIFFSFVKYEKNLYGYNKKKISINKLNNINIILITGIANSYYIKKFLKKKTSKIIHLNYPDHHNFTKKNYLNIYDTYKKINEKKIIITTEKDYMRINSLIIKKLKIFYIPIHIKIINNKKFNSKLIKYVKKN